MGRAPAKPKHIIAFAPGDGASREASTNARLVISEAAKRFNIRLKFIDIDIGGEALDNYGDILPQESINIALGSDAVFFGETGGAKWRSYRGEANPAYAIEKLKGILRLNIKLCFATAFPQLRNFIPFKHELLKPYFNMIFVSDAWEGERFNKKKLVDDYAYDMLYYSRNQVTSTVKKAFELASMRRGNVSCISKMKLFKTAQLWSEIADNIAKSYRNIYLERLSFHEFISELISYPAQFDVCTGGAMMCDNAFSAVGAIFGPCSAMYVAYINSDNYGMYGGTNIPEYTPKEDVNPISSILAGATMLEMSFGYKKEADYIRRAIANVLEAGYRTPDIMSVGKIMVSTSEMTEKICEEIHKPMRIRKKKKQSESMAGDTD